MGVWSVLGVLAFFALGIFQIYAAYVGLEYSVGGGWAIAIMAGSLMFRFTLPVSIGAFVAAVYVWEWHWFFALLFVLPGLVFLVPGIVMSVYEKARGYN